MTRKRKIGTAIEESILKRRKTISTHESNIAQLEQKIEKVISRKLTPYDVAEELIQDFKNM